MYFHSYFFFFQAEDGIRDGHVTGVQTCALPILPSLPVYPDTSTVQRDTIDQTRECNALIDDEHLVVCDFGDVDSDYTIEIGRASCRERVEMTVGGAEL